ncbi:MAG: hypothetical protein ACTSUE_23660 [Promethearchaeota archaeon]
MQFVQAVFQLSKFARERCGRYLWNSVSNYITNFVSHSESNNTGTNSRTITKSNPRTNSLTFCGALAFAFLFAYRFTKFKSNPKPSANATAILRPIRKSNCESNNEPIHKSNNESINKSKPKSISNTKPKSKCESVSDSDSEPDYEFIQSNPRTKSLSDDDAFIESVLGPDPNSNDVSI